MLPQAKKPWIHLLMPCKIKQINCHKVMASTRLYASGVHDISMITEPNVNMIRELKKFGKLFCDMKSQKPRSLILIKNYKIDCTLLPQYTNRDICSVLLEGQNTILISAYLDILLDAWPDILDDVVLYAINKGFRILIGSDSNAHSALWGSNETNERGEVIEEACAAYGLECVNTGTNITYDGVGGQTIVDVTLTSDPNMVQDWHVSPEVTLSDHMCITYTLDGIDKGAEPLHRCTKKVNWKYVAKEMKTIIPQDIPTEWSEATLDQATTAFTSRLKEILDETAPLKAIKKKSNFWWTPTCTTMKSACMKAARIKRRNNNPQNRAAFTAALRAYQNTIYKAKQESWRTFINDINSVSDMSKVNKILKSLKGPTAELGLVKCMDGTLAEDKPSSLRAMFQEHFPNSLPVEVVDKTPSQSQELSSLKDFPWLTINRLKNAISGFKKGKSAGPDEVRVELLQALDEDMLHYLLTLFRASQTLCYVPLAWRYVTCVFLPKVGKPDFTERSAFRPVSLMSFVLKCMEKMCLWRVEETALTNNPLHPRQFGARKGTGTDNALSTVVNTVEKAIMNNQYALGLFMDIKGAFNNLTYDTIMNALHSKEVDADIITWYKHFLTTRIVTSTLGISTVDCKCTKGCPQGGCISSVLWNICFEGFLHAPDDKAALMHGFVDDGSVIIVGPCPDVLYEKMNRVIEQCTSWASSCGLTFCTNKTQACLFTYRDVPINKATGKPFTLSMYNRDIPNVKSTKFLGVTLDKELNFHEHIEKRIKACRLALLRVRPILGHTWSPEPVHTKWLYTTCIIPMLSYGCAIWSKALDERSVQQKLSTLQRMGLLSITPVRRGTPTATLEVLYNIPPLHLLLHQRAEMTYLRLGSLQDAQWTASHQPAITRGRMPKRPKRKNVRRGHLSHIRRNLPNFGQDDCMNPVGNFDRNYAVDTAENLPESRTGIAAYTDGSKIYDQVGSGSYILKHEEPLIYFAERLPDYTTVYQSELRAIQMTCQYLMDFSGHEINFHVDSLSSLQALKASHITSRTVYDTALLLQALGQQNKVSLQKIKAHDPEAKEDAGNVMADKAAKWGAFFPDHMISNATIYKTRTIMKTHINEKHREEWDVHWKSTQGLRQSKLFINGPDPKYWKDIKHMNKKKMSNVIRFISGHCFMNRHHKTVIPTGKRGKCADADPRSRCRLCDLEEETPEHLCTVCPRLLWTRNTLFAQSQILSWTSDRPPPWSKHLLDFIQSDIVQSLDTTEDLVVRSQTLQT